MQVMLDIQLFFSIAIAGLFQNKDNEWLYIAKKWSLISWTFLTGGIALGSYWAYYELGWGGWWFWDPVENVFLNALDCRSCISSLFNDD